MLTKRWDGTTPWRGVVGGVGRAWLPARLLTLLSKVNVMRLVLRRDRALEWVMHNFGRMTKRGHAK